MKSLRINLDSLGMCASGLCMIHCLAFPVLLAALSMRNLPANGADTAVAAQLARTDCSELECCPAPNGADGEVQTASCCSTPTDFWIHVGLLATVAPLGLVAWGVGYRQHRRLGVLVLGLVGVLLLSGALSFGYHLLGGRGEQVMTVLGSICMVSAHLWNRRQCRCCSAPDLAHVVEIDAAPSESQLVASSAAGGVS